MINLLKKLRENNIEIKIVNDQINLSIPDGVDASGIIEEIKHNKIELISFLKGIRKNERFIEISASAEKEYYPLSSAQRRIFFLQEFDTSSTAYNMPQIRHFDFFLDKGRVNEAFNQLILRHESLRTSFHLLEGEPMQKIHPKLDLDLTYYEGDYPDQDRLIRNFFKPFELKEAPLLKAGLINHAVDLEKNRWKSTLLVDMHHIITDGISNQILIDDLLSIYAKEDLPPLKLHYKDYAEWQNEKNIQGGVDEQKKYWLTIFDGQLPSLALPTDYSRSSVKTSKGDREYFQLSSFQSKNLIELAKREEVTIYILFLSLCYVWLMKLSHQEDIVIGSPTSGRNHSDLERIIGMFVNTLALRNYPLGEKNYLSFLKEVKENFATAVDNQDYQFEDLINELNLHRDFNRNPLFDVFLNVDEVLVNDIEFSHLDNEDVSPKTEHVELVEMVSKFDISIDIDFVGDCFELELLYKKELFSPKTIKRFIQYFVNIVDHIIKNPNVAINDIAVLDVREHREYTERLRINLEADPPLSCIQDKLSNSFLGHPHKVAIEYGGKNYSYKELDNRSTFIAEHIWQKNMPNASYIGVLCADKYQAIASMIGILKARHIFVPLNISLPPQALWSQIHLGGITHIISDLSEEKLEAYQVAWKDPEKLTFLSLANISDTHTVSSGNKPVYELDDPIYLYFTSGSTELPKGIVGVNSSLSHFIDWEITRFQIDKDFRISQLIAISFDAFLRDVFVSLAAGATLCIPEDETSLMLDQLVQWVEENEVNLIHCVPTVFGILNSPKLHTHSLPALKYILISGDELNPTSLTNWYHTVGDRINLFNLYGTTETTMIKSCYPMDSSAIHKPRIPIGKPIYNTQILVLDENLGITPELIHGDIYIRTPYRTQGYISQEENKKRFIKNPYSNDPQDLLYKTGDLGRQLLDGNIEYLGRKDHQVKIRGIRVEPGEINAHLLAYENISDSVVVAKKNEQEELKLVAYFVSEEEIEITHLRNYLQSRLPRVMVPHFFQQLPLLPLNANGKVDRKALPFPVETTQGRYTEPTTLMEKQLVQIWAHILGKKEVGIDDNFFSVGGDSLQSLKIVSKLQFQGYDVSIKDIFRLQTIKELATYLASQSISGKPIEIKPAEQRTYYPLSSSQQRIFFMHKVMKDSRALNMEGTYEIPGHLDKNKLKDIFDQLIRRHESLRTSFRMMDNTPVQVVHQKVDFEIIELSNKSLYDPTFHYDRSFDLAKAPLLKVGLVERTDSALLLIDMHHIISDGVSNSILFKEFNELAGGMALPELSIQYKDFTVWQRNRMASALSQRQEQYWLDVFKGPIPVFNLIGDVGAGASHKPQGASLTFQVGEFLCEGLREIVQTRRVPLFSLLLATQSIVFQKLSTQEDIIIGMPTTGRNHDSLANMIGLFLNTIALRLSPQTGKRFDHYVNEVSDHLAEALENQDYQFDELIEKLKLKRDSWRNPLFSIIMVMQNHLDTRSLQVNLSEKIDIVDENPQIDILNDFFFRFLEYKDNILVNIEYNAGLFSKGYMINLFSHFKEVAHQIIENLAIPIENITLSSTLLEVEVATLEEDFDF